MSYSLYPCVTAVVTVHAFFTIPPIASTSCDISHTYATSSIGGMVKGHELLQQLLHRGIGSRTLSLPLYYILLPAW